MAARIKALPSDNVTISFPSMEMQPWAYQKQDIAWMLAQKNGLIGSEVGTGKTILAIGVASYLKQKGRFNGMVVLMPKMAGILPEQWEAELTKFAPDLLVVHGRGKDKKDRIESYGKPWDVLLLNYEAGRNDVDQLDAILKRRNPTVLYCDEASAFRNGYSKTARLVKVIAKNFEYRYAATGTPMQTNLNDLHGICSSMGWTDLVGTKAWFQRQYIVLNKVQFYARGSQRTKYEVVGYKNLTQLRNVLEPWFIRRTLAEPEVSKNIPAVVPFVFRLPMRAEQVRLYRTTQQGIVAEIENGEVSMSYVDAMQRYSKLAAVADGTRTYNRYAEDHSAKSDWLMNALQGSMAGEKVLVFSRFVRSVRPLQERMDKAGIGYGLFLGGDHQTQEERKEDIRRFKEDPDCRVLIATQAVEMGLNLQVARVLVFYSTLSNPKRMEQILGRIRRAGSPYSNVAAITLLSAGTIEEGLYNMAEERNALADALWEEESVLFEQIGAERMHQLVRDWTP